MDLKPVTLTGAQVLAFTDQWRRDAYLLDKDREELLRHYNGGALEEDDEQSGNPRTRRANLLLGYKYLSRPVEQLLSTYDDGLGFLDIRVENDALPPSRRVTVQTILNAVANEEIQRSERLYWPYRANVQDAVINGIGCLYRDDPYDWAPKYGRPYFPWDAPADITDDKFADWAFMGKITLSEIIARLDRLKEVPDDLCHWNRERLVNLAEAMAKRQIAGQTNPLIPSLQWNDPITWREWLQTQSWGGTALMSACPVAIYFAKRFDVENKRPVDMYIVPRWGEVEKEVIPAAVGTPRIEISRNSTDPANLNDILFHWEEAFEDVTKCFFPFQLSVMIGGEPMMRRVMGLGALMYDLDVRIQHSIAAMFDASDFDFSPLFQASDQQSEQELQELAGTQIRPYDVLPTGAKFMDKPKGNRPYTSVFELTKLMSSEMGNQAQSFAGGGEFENKGRAELEVQVLERQQQLATALRLRMADFIRRGDPLATTIGEVLINEPNLIECDKAWPVREAIKKALKKRGVQWKEVAGKCTFQMRRVPGHGDPALALRRAQQTELIAKGLGPAAHRLAQRNLIAAVNGGDTQLALEMVPEVPEAAGMQEQVAMAQASMCLTTFMPAPVLETDNPMAHVPVELKILESQFAIAAPERQWTVQQRRGFEALAAHLLMDIRMLTGISPEMGKVAQKQVDQMIRQSAQFEVVGLQPQIDPYDQAKLKLEAQKLQVTTAKTADDIAHRRRAQDHREEVSNFQENLQLAQLTNAERSAEVDRATKLAKTTVDVAQATTPTTAAP